MTSFLNLALPDPFPKLGSVVVPDCTASYIGLAKSRCFPLFTVCRLYPSVGDMDSVGAGGGGALGKTGELNSTLVP